MDYEDLYFLRSLTIFKKFPLKEVLESPLLCKIVRFEAGAVVAANSNDSDWIYIVKSGSLSVLGRLQNVKPKKKKDGNSHNSSKPEVGVPFQKRRKRRSIVIGSRAHTMVLPTFKNKVEMDMKMAATLPGYFSRHDRLGILDYDVIKTKLQSRVERKPTRSLLSNFLFPLLDGARKPEVAKEDGWVTEEETEENNGEKINLPKITSTQKGAYFSTDMTPPKKDTLHPANVKLPEISDVRTKIRQKSNNGNFTQRIQDLDLRIPRNDPSKVKGPDVFILMQVLQRGQHFGLTDMIFHDQPNVSLVSNGAECYVISKVFYRQNVPLDFMYDLKKSETPFPSCEDLQRSFQTKVNWKSQSRIIYRDLAHSRGDRERRRTQHRVIAGDYNHRAGPL